MATDRYLIRQRCCTSRWNSLILLVALAVIALALPTIRGMKPVYVAESRLLVQNPLTTALASSADNRMIELNLTTEVERLLSRDMAANVIRRLAIDSRPSASTGRP